ncbi:unnamed protein product [Heligmosomoides polygyrus]|uniref:GIY-YIG domain-containing protein n=1 Tax=Heligmosomoides polygyrus TaxID=6339 RepID=A0A183F9P7_HELPZ|nr:unnamed protein product [Heligmosomoides polygyrus]
MAYPNHPIIRKIGVGSNVYYRMSITGVGDRRAVDVPNTSATVPGHLDDHRREAFTAGGGNRYRSYYRFLCDVVLVILQHRAKRASARNADRRDGALVADNWRKYQETRNAAKKAVAVAKATHYGDVNEKLESRDGEWYLYRPAKNRQRQTEDIEKFFGINNENGRLLMNREKALKRWCD